MGSLELASRSNKRSDRSTVSVAGPATSSLNFFARRSRRVFGMFHSMKRSFINDNRRSSRLSNVSAPRATNVEQMGRKLVIDWAFRSIRTIAAHCSQSSLRSTMSATSRKSLSVWQLFGRPTLKKTGRGSPPYRAAKSEACQQVSDRVDRRDAQLRPVRAREMGRAGQAARA